MKRFLIIFLVSALVFSLVGCAGTTPVTQETPAIEQAAEPTTPSSPTEPVKIATLAGPSGMGLIELINDDSGKYSVEILTNPDQIAPKIINAEVDIATVPSNLAAVLYNKMGGGITTVAVTTTGVLYLLSSDDSISALSDIDGNDVVLTGQGATPEYLFNKVVSENGLNTDVTFMPAHADLSNAMAAGDVVTGLLPEPFVSITLAKNPDLHIAVDFNTEWKKLYGDAIEIPMTAVIVSDPFAEENPDALDAFFTDYQASVAYVNNDVDAAAQDIADAGLLPKAEIAKLAIPRCGITFIAGDACKEMLDQFFGVLYESNPSSVGGEVPGEAFYYQR